MNENGDIADAEWTALSAAAAVIFGDPTYVSVASWHFKKCADAKSKAWFTQACHDKVFGGCTNSASLNDDK